MIKRLIPAIAVAAGMLACAPAYADFSACDAASRANDAKQKIDLYTVCLKHGGLASTDVAGAFNNRGVTYQRIGETDKALQDFISATQYDPSWPLFRANRAAAEASKGQCAEALADINLTLKMAPHNRQDLELKDRIVANCPIPSKPAA
jgi:hypothetical protein